MVRKVEENLHQQGVVPKSGYQSLSVEFLLSTVVLRPNEHKIS